jgi:serpin B
LGLLSLFTNADFSLINPNTGLWVSYVLQKTFAQVDETGVEAAVATLLAMAGTDLNEETPQLLNFHVNRPFLFFLKEQSTGIPFLFRYDKESELNPHFP